MTTDSSRDDITKLDYHGVVAALEAFVGDWVSVSIDDADADARVATVEGVLGSGTPQETLEGGLEGILFIVGDVPRSYRRGPSLFCVWCKPFRIGLRQENRVSFRMGSTAVVVDRTAQVSPTVPPGQS